MTENESKSVNVMEDLDEVLAHLITLKKWTSQLQQDVNQIKWFLENTTELEADPVEQ